MTPRTALTSEGNSLRTGGVVHQIFERDQGANAHLALRRRDATEFLDVLDVHHARGVST